MKILFILFTLSLNFILFLTPGLLLNKGWQKWKKKSLFTVNLTNFYDRMLTITPFAIWSIFYIFDPEQKTVRQIVFPDPLIIGFFTILFLMLNHRNPDHMNSAKIQWSYIIVTNVVAIGCWFLINPMV